MSNIVLFKSGIVFPPLSMAMHTLAGRWSCFICFCVLYTMISFSESLEGSLLINKPLSWVTNANSLTFLRPGVPRLSIFHMRNTSNHALLICKLLYFYIVLNFFEHVNKIACVMSLLQDQSRMAEPYGRQIQVSKEAGEEASGT